MINIKAKVPRERYQIDLVNLMEFPQQNKSYKHLLNIVNVFSSFNMATLIKSKTGIEMAKTLQMVFQQFGFPKILQNDNGTKFVDAEIKGFFKNNVTCIV